jgi:hypothetical protein
MSCSTEVMSRGRTGGARASCVGVPKRKTDARCAGRARTGIEDGAWGRGLGLGWVLMCSVVFLWEARAAGSCSFGLFEAWDWFCLCFSLD